MVDCSDFVGTAVRKYNPDKDDWIEICVASNVMSCSVISDAAIHQKKVEVEVTVDNESKSKQCFKLIGITIPAK